MSSSLLQTLNSYPVSFYFQLSFPGVDAAFQEVSGISKELGIEEVVSGGENRFKWKLPTITTSQNLVLKRALVPVGSPLIAWASATMDTGLSLGIRTLPVMLSLLDISGMVYQMWVFHDAYPVKYSVSEFKSQESGIVIESMELAYSYFDISIVTATAVRAAEAML